MIAVETEEMHGSDRDSGSENDYERALVGKAKSSTRAKWRSFMSACRSVFATELDSADIVREAMFRQLSSDALVSVCVINVYSRFPSAIALLLPNHNVLLLLGRWFSV